MQTRPNNLYSVEFFDLQLRFAARVAELSGAPLAETVGSYTNIYVRLGMGQRLNVANPDWQEYVSALVTSNSPAELTSTAHRHRIHLPIGPATLASIGCFSYTPVDSGCVRLHFHCVGEPSESPLSSANRQLRERELAALLTELRSSSGDDVCVVGASWLYNIRPYRRLFPEPYVASLRAVEHPYQRMPLWGQFLNRDRSVRPEMASRFLAKVARASSLVELSSSFPLPVLATKAPAKWLYEHVGA